MTSFWSIFSCTESSAKKSPDVHRQEHRHLRVGRKQQLFLENEQVLVQVDDVLLQSLDFLVEAAGVRSRALGRRRAAARPPLARRWRDAASPARWQPEPAPVARRRPARRRLPGTAARSPASTPAPRRRRTRCRRGAAEVVCDMMIPIIRSAGRAAPADKESRSPNCSHAARSEWRRRDRSTQSSADCRPRSCGSRPWPDRAALRN